MSLHAEYPLSDKEWIGTKVMCRSNEDMPLLVGTFKGFDMFPNFSAALVEDENGREWVVMGEIWPYDEDIYQILSKLSPEKQYDFMVKVRLIQSMLLRGRAKGTNDD